MTIIVNGGELSANWMIALAVIGLSLVAVLAFFVYDLWRTISKASAWLDEEQRRRNDHGHTPPPDRTPLHPSRTGRSGSG